MVKIGKPKGLIRYASYNSIANGISRIITGRVTGYSFVLFSLVAILGFALVTRSDVETTMLKIPGTLYQREGEFVTNLYNVEFVNKTFDVITVKLVVESPQYAEVRKADGKDIVIPAEGLARGVYFIKIPEKEITNARTTVKLGVYDNGRKIETIKAKFIGPVTKASDAKRN